MDCLSVVVVGASDSLATNGIQLPEEGDFNQKINLER